MPKKGSGGAHGGGGKGRKAHRSANKKAHGTKHKGGTGDSGPRANKPRRAK